MILVIYFIYYIILYNVIYVVDIADPLKFKGCSSSMEGHRSPYLCHKPWRTTSSDLLLFWLLRGHTAPEVRPETPCLLFLGLHPHLLLLPLLLLLFLLSFSRCCPCQHLRPSCASGRAKMITNHSPRITSSKGRTTTRAWLSGSTSSGGAIHNTPHNNSV